MSNAEAAVEPRNEYVDFWNTILVPKFVRWAPHHRRWIDTA